MMSGMAGTHPRVLDALDLSQWESAVAEDSFLEGHKEWDASIREIPPLEFSVSRAFLAGALRTLTRPSTP
jgi:hypothetical protein